MGEHEIPTWRPEWCVFEVSGALRAGQNLLALHLPWGYISYRVYLSPDEPRCYPDLGPQKNAQWVDFRDFVTWTRYDALRRGMEMIRREAPDKFIKQMSVGAMIGSAKALSEDYGGAFHDTGGMAGSWNDYLPSVARGAGMLFTAESGGPAGDLRSLKTYIGRYATEGVPENMRRIAEISEQLHQQPGSQTQERLEVSLDEEVADVYGLADNDLVVLRDFFAFLQDAQE